MTVSRPCTPQKNTGMSIIVIIVIVALMAYASGYEHGKQRKKNELS
jgi:hypothetical protein